MKFIIVPFTELLAYIESTLDLWPHGHRLPEDKRERDNQLTLAAGELCKNLILQSVKHIRNKPDPLVQLLHDLGYPIKSLSTEELDDLMMEVDDHYIYLTVLFDTVDDKVQPYLERKVFTMVVEDEDVLIEVTGDLINQRYQALKRRLKDRTPPKIGEDELNTQAMAEYIDRMVGEVLGSVQSPAMRDELKLIFDQAIKRY